MQVLPGAAASDTTQHGYGPFPPGECYGLVLHVNASNGRLEDFFRRSDQVTPNFQAYKNGDLVQYLPVNWRPWCQGGPGGDGNFHYGAIETEGYPWEPLTEPQLQAVVIAVRAYHLEMGMPLQEANVPGERGLAWHGMGGVPWGGHPGCPGEPRKAQRTRILQIASGATPAPDPTPEVDMSSAQLVSHNGSVYVADAFTYRGVRGPLDLAQLRASGLLANDGKVKQYEDASNWNTFTKYRKRGA